MASDVEKRIAKALLSARSHIGSCRPDYDEDDAAWWDELTELAELVTQPAVGEAITSNASLAGEAVAFNFGKVYHFASEHGVDYNRLCKLVRECVYTHPPAAEVDEAMVERAQAAWYAAGPAPCSTARDWMRAALTAALSPPGRAEGEDRG